MGSETVHSRAAATPAPEPAVALASCTVLVISRDPVERQDLVLALGAHDQVEAASAAGFHMAVPMIWSTDPDAIVLGALTPADARRLAELRHHAPRARIIHLASAGDEYGEARADATVPPGGDLVATLSALLPAER